MPIWLILSQVCVTENRVYRLELALLAKHENICDKIIPASAGAFSHFNVFRNCAKRALHG